MKDLPGSSVRAALGMKSNAEIAMTECAHALTNRASIGEADQTCGGARLCQSCAAVAEVARAVKGGMKALTQASDRYSSGMVGVRTTPVRAAVWQKGQSTGALSSGPLPFIGAALAT